MSKFDSQFYSRYRPLYPGGLYATWKTHLDAGGICSPYQALDVGCGTGHSILSACRGGVDASWTALDSDPEMLTEARSFLRTHAGAVNYVVASAERLPFESETLDLVQVASAFHWMRAEETASEFLRVLRMNGLLAMCEYQFPKSKDLLNLNEWIRREFNLRWKAPQQRPRGSFKEITSIFRQNPRFQLLEDGPHPMMLSMSADDLLGLLLSQSRVLHFENLLDLNEILDFRSSLLDHLESEMKGQNWNFDFALSYVLFRKVA